LHQRYKDKAQFLAVYVREAHPIDGWRMQSNDKAGIQIPQPRNIQERNKVAQKCSATLEITMPLVVDDIHDHVGNAYSGMPDRLYVIDRWGKVVYKGGRGPFGFKTGEMEQSLLMLLLDENRNNGKTSSRFPLLDNAQAWKSLPPAKKGSGRRLPAWARILARSLPETTAAMLHLDYLHRVRSPLDPILRSKIRWVAATANRCEYTRLQAEADLVRAGLSTKAINALKTDPASSEDERRILAFARKMTLAANTVTDEEMQRLIKKHGEKQVVAMVLLLAWSNFQDRLFLSLGVTPELENPLPPFECVFDKFERQPVPRRGGSAVPPQVAQPDLGPDWFNMKFRDLQGKLEQQRSRQPRIRVPSWDELIKVMPEAAKRKNPLRIRWSLVAAGYQPDLTKAWFACTGGFANDSAMDRVLEESIFWVVTRTLACFY
jgi:alkylhydroperoxidase family enzyme